MTDLEKSNLFAQWVLSASAILMGIFFLFVGAGRFIKKELRTPEFLASKKRSLITAAVSGAIFVLFGLYCIPGLFHLTSNGINTFKGILCLCAGIGSFIIKGRKTPESRSNKIRTSVMPIFGAIIILYGLYVLFGVFYHSSNEAYAYNTNGWAKLQRGDYDDAIIDFDHAIELDPKFMAAYNNRSLAKAQKGDYDGAITDSTRAIELDPKRAAAYTVRAVEKVQKSDYDGAIADYNRAIELDPKLAFAYGYRSIAKAKKGDQTGADVDIATAHQLDPNVEKEMNPQANR
jgi:prolipoprotein diacylglyceryltransferase